MSSLADIRRSKGLLQRQVAEAAGITRSSYTLIETGLRTPSVVKSRKLADILGVTLDQFYDALYVTQSIQRAE